MGKHKTKAYGGGFTLCQDGDTEGSLLFNGSDEKQWKAAIRVMGPTRMPTPQTAGLHGRDSRDAEITETMLSY